MTATDVELAAQEIRTARRLARLFRIERSGVLGRRSLEMAHRFIDRRGQLIDELVRLEEKRRRFAPWSSVDLEIAMATLEREVNRSESRALERLAELGAELRRLRGEGAASGLRDRADGRLLGRG